MSSVNMPAFSDIKDKYSYMYFPVASKAQLVAPISSTM